MQTKFMIFMNLASRFEIMESTSGAIIARNDGIGKGRREQ